MSHKHAHLMRSIFQDPPSANIHWREIESLLHHLGADVEPSHGARFKITLNKVEAFLHHPHNSSTCSKTGYQAVARDADACRGDAVIVRGRSAVSRFCPDAKNTPFFAVDRNRPWVNPLMALVLSVTIFGSAPC
jgi:hypothetical protein